MVPNGQWWIFPPSSAVLQGNANSVEGLPPKRALPPAGLPFDCISPVTVIDWPCEVLQMVGCWSITALGSIANARPIVIIVDELE